MSTTQSTPTMPTENDDAASTVSGITTVTGTGRGAPTGRGRGRGGRGFGGRSRGGRGRNRTRSNSSTSNTSSTTTKTDKFVGMTQALEGNCFHIPAEKPKRTEFISTLEAIRLFSSDKYKS